MERGPPGGNPSDGSERATVRMRKTRKKLPWSRVNVHDPHPISWGGVTYDSEPRKEHRDSLVKELDQESKLAQQAMTASPNIKRMRQRIYRGKKGPIKPTSSLQNQLAHLIRYIRLSVAALDILQHPVAITFAHELETENSVLGEIHVRGKDTSVAPMHLLTLEILLKRTIAVQVVLQRCESVRTERTRKHRDEPEHALQRFVEDVTHLVLEVLCRDQRIQKCSASRP